jgi:hypothetical protein
MSRAQRDLLTLIERCTYSDDYDIPGSTFLCCRICERESGAGVLFKPDWHSASCPVPRLQAKYAGKGQRRGAA